jgi:ABC-type antimicrobial peptide transport system permease subunit
MGDDSIVPASDMYEFDEEDQNIAAGKKKNLYIKSGTAPVNQGEAAVPIKFKEMGYEIGDTISITLNTNSAYLNFNSPEVEAIKEHLKKLNEESADEKHPIYRYIIELEEPEYVEGITLKGTTLESAFALYGPVLFENCTESNYFEFLPLEDKRIENAQTITVKITGFTEQNYYKFASHSDGFNTQKAVLNGTVDSYDQTFPTAFARIDKDSDFNEAVETLYVDLGYDKNNFLIDNQGKLAYNSILLALEFRDYNAIASVIMIYAFLIVVALIVWLICRFSIDNAFEISVQERVVHFNTMRTLGASKKQIAVVVLFEAIFYSLFAVPLGMLLAILTCKLSIGYIVESGIENMLTQTAAKGQIISAYIDPRFMLIAVGITLVAIFISAYTSAMWAGRNSTINEALSYGKPHSAKKQAKRVTKLGRVKNFIFTYTVQNIKRTKKRFLISVVTMSLGVLMFVFTSVISVNLLLKFVSISNINQSDLTVDIWEYDELSDIDAFYDDEFSENTHTFIYGFSNNTANGKGFEDFFEQISGDDYTYELDENGIVRLGDIVFIDENAYNAFIKPTYKKSYSEFVSEKKGILSYGSYELENETDKKFYSAGEGELPKAVINSENVSKKSMEFEIAGAMQADYVAAGAFFLPIEFFEDFNEDFFPYSRIMLNIYLNDDEDAYDKAYAVIEEYDSRYGGEGCDVSVDNYLLNNKLGALLKGIIIMVSSFILIMWLIGIVNMVNTINTGVLNRRRELAMLKAVGTSSKMINKSIYLESMMFAFTSTLIGLLIADVVAKLFLSAELFSDSILGTIVFVGINVITIILNVIIAVLAAKPSLNTIKKKNINNLLNNIE